MLSKDTAGSAQDAPQEVELRVNSPDESAGTVDTTPDQNPRPERVNSQSIEIEINEVDGGSAGDANGQTVSVKESESRTGCCACCQRTRMAHCCIDSWTLTYADNKKTGKKDASLEVVLVPEAFRMWFYYGWWIFIISSIFISLMFSTDMDLSDNVFKTHYNSVSPCIFFDYPPFSYFGAIAWLPQIFTLVMYELLDQFRVYDAYHDGEKISKRFYRWYSVCTVFECCSFLAFEQTMATGPDEQWQIHSAPYLMMIYGIHCLMFTDYIACLWTMAFKRFMYLERTGVLEDARSEDSRCPKLKVWGARFYVYIMLITVILKTGVLWPNWAGAKMWTISGLEWTDAVLQYSVYAWFFLVLIVPIFMYWALTEKLDKVKFVINRVPTL